MTLPDTDLEFDIAGDAYLLGKRHAEVTRGRYREGPLSGEFADQWTPGRLAGALARRNPEATLAIIERLNDVLCEAFEDGYEDVCRDADAEAEMYPHDDPPSLELPWWEHR